MSNHRKLTRMEANKETRRILIRHYVDLTYCMFSCSGTEVRLTGWLTKIDGSEFNAPMIESMLHEFWRRMSGYSIVGDLENWNFNSERITFVGDKDIRSSGGTGDSEEIVIYEINLDDYDFEAS